MSDFQDLPCGSWPSPISASLIATGTALLNNLWSHRGRMWWTESRPAESGRNALVCDGEDIWDSVSVRTRVHSYGGGAWWPDGKGGVYACDDADGRLWHLTAGGEARPVSPEPAVAHSRRYADGRADGTTTVCVLEEHQSEDQAQKRSGEPDRAVRWQWIQRAGDRGHRGRLLRLAPAQPRRSAVGLDPVGSPQHALGSNRAVGGRSAGDSGHRLGGGTPVGSRRPPLCRERPQRLVESLPPGWRTTAGR